MTKVLVKNWSFVSKLTTKIVKTIRDTNGETQFFGCDCNV